MSSQHPGVFGERSRSPSPANLRHTIQNSHPTTSHSRDNLLHPENANLLAHRRSHSPDNGSRKPFESIPLIHTTTTDPPLADPEIDGLGDDDRDFSHDTFDDGFLFDRSNADGPTIDGDDSKSNGVDLDSTDGRRIQPSRNHRFPDIEFGPATDLESIPDINVYQHKKTLAQGMMDLALFSANANQLRYVLESDRHPYYYPGIVLISFSLLLQVAIGVGLIWNARYNVKDEKEICIANRINNFTVIGIFLVTVVNVFISAFGVASVQPVVAASTTP